MKSRIFLQGYLLIGTILLATACKNDQGKEAITSSVSNREEPLFERVSHTKSGLVFNNAIQEDLSSLANLFNFDYFYNGAGVGTEDLNNDGLPDIVFTGNQVENRIFLNKGNLEFEDITATANINQGKQWSNGVTFVDIDQDGWMDIYISQGGPNQRLQRKNLLFRNMGDGSFEEVAEAYGLADMGISTQSAFFDMDNDGDLDCIVMNENELYGLDPIRLKNAIGSDKETQYFNSAHLYMNDGGKFRNITEEAGLLRPVFGLGLLVSDVNKDGLLDIYIASDYFIPDALYINQGNGRFEDQIKDYTRQISFFGMGVDKADINNDALEDIFVLDMASSDHIRSKTLMASMNTSRFDYLVNTAGYHYQYMFNSLQLNEGNNHFSNVAQLLDVGKTDWSWSVLMTDYDLDGNRDIYVTNGYRRYALDNDLQRKVFNAQRKYKNQVPLEIKRQLYDAMPSEKLPNILYRNEGDLDFSETAASWGLGDASFSNGAAMADLDLDGDLDLVVNNMDDNAFLYRNRAIEQQRGNYLIVEANGQTTESFPHVQIHYDGKTQAEEIKRVRGYMSAQEPIAYFGLGSVQEIDSVVTTWPGGERGVLRKVSVNQRLRIGPNTEDVPSPENKTIFEKDRNAGARIAAHQENAYDDFAREILLPYKQSTSGPAMVTADVNGDGIEDLWMGGASGQAGQVLLQHDTGFNPTYQPALENDREKEDTAAVFFDFDGDGDQDLYVVSGGNEYAPYSSYYADRLYLNDGTGQFSPKPLPVLESYPQSGRAAMTLDYDQDGDQDLLVGNRIIPQNYPRHAPSKLYKNENGELVDVTSEIIPGLEDLGIINDLLATDLNNDGWTDIVAVGEWGPIQIFQNNKGSYEQLQLPGSISDKKGWWFSVTPTDADGDGLTDLVLGNVGANLKFHPSMKKPLKIYATDFDENGTHDVVLSKDYKGKLVPVRGRECSSQQMPFIEKKFQSYKEFANASLEDVYGEKLKDSYEREATDFHSYVLLNKGNMQFEIMKLPSEAQSIPIMDVVSLDVDSDGAKDLILGGNIYETEVETPRLDALSGIVLRNTGNGQYEVVERERTGLYPTGNIKDMVLVKNKLNTWVVFGRNNEKPLFYALINN